MTTLPTWAVWTLAFATPALAFAGGLIAQLVTRRGHKEQEMRAKREEVLRTLRWAAELAVSADQAQQTLGLMQLRSLFDSELLGNDEKEFVRAALLAVVQPAVEQIEEAGKDVQVIVTPDPGAGARAVVSSEGEPVDEGDGT